MGLSHYWALSLYHTTFSTCSDSPKSRRGYRTRNEWARSSCSWWKKQTWANKGNFNALTIIAKGLPECGSKRAIWTVTAPVKNLHDLALNWCHTMALQGNWSRTAQHGTAHAVSGWWQGTEQAESSSPSTGQGTGLFSSDVSFNRFLHAGCSEHTFGHPWYSRKHAEIN